MEWILCDERLPKEGQMVLTTIRGHDVIIIQDEETFEEAIERVWNEVCYVSVGFIGSDGWYGADGCPLIVYPIAWMPLPKPYRKTENSSEIPNNSTISKMEQVDEPQTDGYMTAEQTEDYRKMLDKAERKVYGNIEDEPQTDIKCSKCKHNNERGIWCHGLCKYKPQTDCAWK